ncbi:MAG: AraC family transcriptional regulator ligand-binding domain-containing protein [Venatoribacter sp.]
MAKEFSLLSASLLRPALEKAGVSVFEQLGQTYRKPIQEAIKKLRDTNGYIDTDSANLLLSYFDQHCAADLCVLAMSELQIHRQCSLRHWFLCSQDLQEALSRLERFASVLYPFLTLQIGFSAEQLLSLQLQAPNLNRQHTELIVSALLNWLQQLLGEEFKASRIKLPFSAPSYAGSYSQAWQCPVEFNQANCCIDIASHWASKPIQPSLESLQEALQLQVEQQFRSLVTGHALVDYLQQAFTQGKLSLEARQDQAAEFFFISARTLNRQLKLRDTSYKQIQNQARMARACALLEHTDQDIESIALDVGLSGRRAFDRAFLKELGVTPAHYRLAHKQAA